MCNGTCINDVAGPCSLPQDQRTAATCEAGKKTYKDMVEAYQKTEED